MKRVFIILGVCIILVLGSCETDNNNQETQGGSTVTQSLTRYDVVAAPIDNIEPLIMALSTDDTYNYFIIDAGLIKNVPISSGSIISYNGQTAMEVEFTKTTVSEIAVENSLSTTVSESVITTKMNTAGGKIGIETGGIAKLFGAKISAEGNYSRTWGTETENAYSTTSTLTTATRFSESISESIKYTIGNRNEKAGDYRLSLVAACDIYFFLTTNRDNSVLIESTAVICARSIPQPRYVVEYDVAGGNFGITTSSQKIDFKQDFYKSLPVPPPSRYRTEFKTIRTSTQKITHSGQFNQHFDVVRFDVFGVDLNTMKQEGYKTINFLIRLDVREIDDGYQYISLFSSANQSNNYLIASCQFEHSPGKDTTWWTHFEDELRFNNISIDKFVNNQFIIRYDASGNNNDTWENKNLKIQLVFNR